MLNSFSFSVNGKQISPIKHNSSVQSWNALVYKIDNIFKEMQFYWIDIGKEKTLIYCTKTTTFFNSSMGADVVQVDASPISDWYIKEVNKNAYKVDHIDGLSSANVIDALNIIVEFIGARVLFTSMDIANAVKRQGLWIKNRRVSDLMNFSGFISKILDLSDYESQMVKMASDGKDVEARLYLPKLSSWGNYPGTAQKALTPNEVKYIAGQLSVSPVRKLWSQTPSIPVSSIKSTRDIYYIVER